MFMQMQRYSIILIRGSCWCGQDMAKRLFQMNRFELATSTDLNWCEFWISFKLIFLSNWGQSFCINSNEFPWENPEIHSYSWERAFFQTASNHHRRSRSLLNDDLKKGKIFINVFMFQLFKISKVQMYSLDQ